MTEEQKALQRVVCAANRNKAGFVLLGARHWDSWMCKTIDALGYNDHDWEQGFIDQFGNFLTREEAAVIAKQKDQLKGMYNTVSEALFSEHLY